MWRWPTLIKDILSSTIRYIIFIQSSCNTFPPPTNMWNCDRIFSLLFRVDRKILLTHIDTPITFYCIEYFGIFLVLFMGCFFLLCEVYEWNKLGSHKNNVFVSFFFLLLIPFILWFCLCKIQLFLSTFSGYVNVVQVQTFNGFP